MIVALLIIIVPMIISLIVGLASRGDKFDTIK